MRVSSFEALFSGIVAKSVWRRNCFSYTVYSTGLNSFLYPMTSPVSKAILLCLCSVVVWVVFSKKGQHNNFYITIFCSLPIQWPCQIWLVKSSSCSVTRFFVATKKCKTLEKYKWCLKPDSLLVFKMSRFWNYAFGFSIHDLQLASQRMKKCIVSLNPMYSSEVIIHQLGNC